MNGFDKIEFGKDQNPTPVRQSTNVQTSSAVKVDQNVGFMKVRKKNKIKMPRKVPAIILGIVVVLLIFVALISIPAYATYKSGLKTYREAKLIATAVKQQNIEVASTEIAKTKVDLQGTQKNFHKLIPLKFIPIISWYYNDVDHLLNAGSHGLDSAAIVVDSLKPYEDVLGLKGKGSFTQGSAEDRIKTAVMTIGKITPQIDELSKQLVLVKEDVDAVDPNHYPEFIFGKKIKTQLASLRDLTDEGTSFVTQAKPLVKILPSLLGESEVKKYLVIFQNNKELRPTGGFITAYAIFSIDKGIIHLDKSDDIYALDDSIPNKPSAPAPILKFLPKVYTLNLRDSNLSPDFIESMKTFRSMYDRAGERSEVDGIIAIDADVLVSTIKILDDQVQAGGQTFTTQNDARCNCPQVIYSLEDSISRPVNYVKTARKSIIGDLIQAIMVKSLSSSPKKYWGPLFQSFVAQTSQKHVLFDLYDEQAQSGIEALNVAGRIRSFDGDYLHINEANFSGAKVNIFMQETVDNEYDVQNDRSIIKKVTIHYKNPFPPSDCNLERGGLCLNAVYRDWLRIYVPKGSQLVESKGSIVKISTHDELGKTVFEGFMGSVRPQGIGTFTITYKLPFKLTSGSPLPMLIQKQPGTEGNTYNIIVNGNTRETFPLLTDKEEKLKL